MSNENLTEKTLADVQAGIPARDAEIEALRKENAELREQLDAIGAGGVKGRLMPVANADRETLMRSIVQAGQRAGIIRADLESASVSECLHILECLGQPAAPVSAEPVTMPEGWKLVPVQPTEEMLVNVDEEVGGSCHSCSAWRASEDDCKRVWAAMIEASPIAPVAAQPDLTQQTLDDVMAGIPARDAEIAALCKEIETLRAAQAQQPVSGADGLDERAEFEKAWTSYPGRKTPIRFDDGEYQYPAANTAWKFWQARSALAQQDAETGKSVSVENQRVTQREADKVDADRYRFIRDGEQDVWCSVGDWPLSGDELDAAIDAVRKEQE